MQVENDVPNSKRFLCEFIKVKQNMESEKSNCSLQNYNYYYYFRFL